MRLPILEGVRPLEDDQLDRREVEAQQCVELTRTNGRGLDRRKIMIYSNLVQAAVVLGFLFVRQAGDLWLLYLLLVIQFALAALFVPARTAVIPQHCCPT
jgi:Na+/melibiose symporter-like transporter